MVPRAEGRRIRVDPDHGCGQRGGSGGRPAGAAKRRRRRHRLASLSPTGTSTSTASPASGAASQAAPSRLRANGGASSASLVKPPAAKSGGPVTQFCSSGAFQEATG